MLAFVVTSGEMIKPPLFFSFLQSSSLLLGLEITERSNDNEES